MTDCRCMFSTSDQHRKLNQLRWQNVSAHLTNETSHWLKTLLMHLDWAIYNVSDLNIEPHACFFPDLVTGSGSANPVSTARGLSATQREACMRLLTTQKPKRLPRVMKCLWLLTCVVYGVKYTMYGMKSTVQRLLPGGRHLDRVKFTIEITTCSETTPIYNSVYMCTV